MDERLADVCRVIVLTCIDFRFVEPLRRHLQAEGLTGEADVIALPGGGMALVGVDREAVVRAMEISLRLRSPEQVMLVAHRDCGAIGGSGAFASAEAEVATITTSLAASGRFVADRFPQLEVRSVLFDGSGEPASV